MGWGGGTKDKGNIFLPLSVFMLTNNLVKMCQLIKDRTSFHRELGN